MIQHNNIYANIEIRSETFQKVLQELENGKLTQLQEGYRKDIYRNKNFIHKKSKKLNFFY